MMNCTQYMVNNMNNMLDEKCEKYILLITQERKVPATSLHGCMILIMLISFILTCCDMKN